MLDRAILALAHEPRLLAANSITGHQYHLQIRGGDYGVGHEAQGHVQLVPVIAATHRSEVYVMLRRRGLWSRPPSKAAWHLVQGAASTYLHGFTSEKGS